MADPFGASQEAWHHWSERLGLAEHLLPVVANPGATISPDSKMQLLGKTPSRYNFRGEASGFAKWTEHVSTPREIGQWEQNPDYGICVQSREGSLRGIDIDVPGIKASRAIVEAIEAALPVHNWAIRRTREGTGKLLLPFRYEGELPKSVLQVEGGAIEILGDGQQWIADSSYLVLDTQNKSNSKQRVNGRYLWPAGAGRSIDDHPLLTPGDMVELRATLEMLFGKGEWQIARMRRDKPVDRSPRPMSQDDVADWLLANWDVREDGRDGQIYIRCPFDSEHTSDSGPSETVYYPAGTGGYERGHFKCLHAHCTTREKDEFLAKLGFNIADQFPIVEAPEPGTEVVVAAPRYMIDKQGRKENRPYNHELFLQHGGGGMKIAWDDYSAQIVRCPEHDAPGKERWGLFSDEHYVRLAVQMDRNGFVPFSPSALRPSVHAHAMTHRVDLLIEWVNRLPEWDGVPRIETFWVDYAAAEDTPYIRAVGRYSWTAQAGRALDPGCQVDMVPILVSEQGERKSSFIAAIAPAREMFTEVNLMERDEDTSRKMRGKCVIELEELRGLKSRSAEDVKAFITRRVEEWTPKYQEFTKQFYRRFLFYGTTNQTSFLGDPTGERRYLPFHVGGAAQLNVEQLVEDREQLWAEAVAVWRQSGVQWQDAERLGKEEHGQFKDVDSWTEPLKAWVLEDDPLAGGRPADRDFSGSEALIGALGLRASTIEAKHAMRLGAALKGLGFKNIPTRQGRRYRLVDPAQLGDAEEPNGLNNTQTNPLG